MLLAIQRVYLVGKTQWVGVVDRIVADVGVEVEALGVHLAVRRGADGVRLQEPSQSGVIEAVDCVVQSGAGVAVVRREGV